MLSATATAQMQAPTAPAREESFIDRLPGRLGTPDSRLAYSEQTTKQRGKCRITAKIGGRAAEVTARAGHVRYVKKAPRLLTTVPGVQADVHGGIPPPGWSE